MEINSIKTRLRNLVLLAKEYKEKLNDLEAEEMRHIEEKIENQQQISIYESQFLRSVWGMKRNILNEINYHSKKILDEFAEDRPKHEPLEIDTEKVEYARRVLSKEEFNLLGELYGLVVYQQHLEADGDGNYQKVKIREISQELEKFMNAANTVGVLSEKLEEFNLVS